MRSSIGFALVVAMGLLVAPRAHAQTLQLAEPTLRHSHAAPTLLGASLNLNKLLLDASEASVPLDLGGGEGRTATADPATRQAICFIIGFFPGFGLGHLLAGHKDGFMLFLIIDTAFVVGAIVLSIVAPWPFYALCWVAWVVEHVFQGYDAYVASGGEKLVQRSVQRVLYAGRHDDDDGSIVPPSIPTIRAFSLSF